MSSIMRRTVRGAAAGMGALAIIAGTAACGGLLPGGGGEETTAEESGTEETEDTGGEETDESGGTEETDGTGGEETDESGGEETDDSGTSEGSEGTDGTSGEETDDSGTTEDDAADEGDDTAAGGALTDEDLTAVGDVYFEFLQAAVAADGEKACSLITNPNTGEPLSGAEAAGCAQGFEGQAEESGGIDPSVADSLDRSMVEAVDNGDGTAGVTVMGSDAGVVFVKAGDGNWYMDGGQFL